MERATFVNGKRYIVYPDFINRCVYAEDEEGDNMKTFFEIAFEVLGCAVLVIGMITIFVGAVVQESYKNYPPTAEEIAENPELVRYAK